MGSIETRFGSRSELKSLITTAHDNRLSVIADVVINHNSGGDILWKRNSTRAVTFVANHDTDEIINK